MPNRTEARSAKAALTNATGRLPLLRLFSTLLRDPVNERNRLIRQLRILQTEKSAHKDPRHF